MVKALEAFVIGLLAGGISGALGIGGAVLSTPGIRVFLHTPAIIAVGTTLPVIIPTTLTSVLWTYSRKRLIDYRLTVTAAPAGGAFAILGAWASDRVPGEILLILTAILMLTFAYRMYPRKRATSAALLDPSVKLFVVVGALSGFLAGFLGVGGGIVLVPVFTELLRMPVHRAVGTSLAIVTAQAVPGSVVHALLHHIDWRIAAGLTIGVVPGAWASSRWAVAARDRTLQVILSGAMAAASVAFGASELHALLT
jgi:hypothetical protein